MALQLEVEASAARVAPAPSLEALSTVRSLLVTVGRHLQLSVEFQVENQQKMLLKKLETFGI
jgi:hypothetical protein